MIIISILTSIIINLHNNIKKIKFNNLEIDFRNIYNKKNLGKELISFKIKSKILIKKNIDIKDIGFLELSLKNVRIIHLHNLNLNDEILYYFLKNSLDLEEISLINSINYTNNLFKILSKYSKNLKNLYIGGDELNYNNNISLEGIILLKNNLLNLKKLKFYFCGRIGDDCLKELSEIKDIEEIEIIRNSLDNSAKISNKGINYLSVLPNLKKLSINYSRKFSEGFNKILSKLRNLEFLNLRECVIQDSLDLLAENLKNLKLIDLSGDSWLKIEVLDSLNNLSNLKILKIGHLGHGIIYCNSLRYDNNFFNHFERIFLNKDNFKNLKYIYLEQNCSFTSSFEMILNKIRPNIIIKIIKPKKDYEIFLEEKSKKLENIFKF